jgi:hypothetical protein
LIIMMRNLFELGLMGLIALCSVHIMQIAAHGIAPLV